MIDLQHEVENVLADVHEQIVFKSAAEFSEFLKDKGLTVSIEDIKKMLIDMKSSKVELDFDDMEEVTGGAQVEIVNDIKNNDQPVKVGSVIVIGM